MMRPLVHLPLDPKSSNPFIDPTRNIVPLFTRDTKGLSQDLQGNYVTVGRQSYRWYKSAAGKFYLVLESACTNLLASTSENLIRWIIAGTISVYAKTQIGPDGEYSADEVVFDATQTDGVVSAGCGDKHGVTLTYSVWLKASSGTPSVRMRINSNSSYESVKALTTTWTRYTFKQALAGGDTNTVTLELRPDDTSAPTVYVWGVQLEASPVATTYVPTTPRLVQNPNLIIDGEMELDGVANWTVITSATFAKDASTVGFGKQSLKVSGNSADGVSQTVTVVSGASYRLSAWVLVTAGSARIGATNPTSSGLVSSSASWTYLEMAIKPNSTTTVIKLTAGAASTVAYFDRVQLVKQLCPEPSFEAAGTPPSPWTMAGGATYSVDTTIFHSSLNAGRITCSAAADGIAVNNTNMSLANSTWYFLSAWIYIVSQSGASIVPMVTSHADYNLTLQLAKSTVGAWQRITAVFQTGTLAGSDKITFAQNATGTLVFDIDDVSIVPLDSVSLGTRNAEYLDIPLNNSQPSNLFTFSEDFTQAAWVFTTTTLTANDTTVGAAPDGGTSTVSKFAFAGNTTDTVKQTLPSVSVSTAYCFSIWLKAANTDYMNTIVLKLDDGVATVTKAVMPTTIWRRFFVTITSNAAATTLIASLLNSVNGAAINLWAWGAQIEKASYPSQYVKVLSLNQTPVFSGGFASPNIVTTSGALSFFCIVPFMGVSASANTRGILGDKTTFGIESGLLYGASDFIFRITGIDKTGAASIKVPDIVGTVGSSATVEHFICVSWGAERDSNGKLQQLRLKAYFDGVKLLDQTYSGANVQEWTYTPATLILANSSNNAYVRDIKIWPGPLTDSEVTDLYTGVVL